MDYIPQVLQCKSSGEEDSRKSPPPTPEARRALRWPLWTKGEPKQTRSNVSSKRHLASSLSWFLPGPEHDTAAPCLVPPPLSKNKAINLWESSAGPECGVGLAVGRPAIATRRVCAPTSGARVRSIGWNKEARSPRFDSPASEKDGGRGGGPNDRHPLGGGGFMGERWQRASLAGS
ncbi:hypothetical protein SKAU_G00147390 [Synaphobranchus kaupii]|uniref:Uncharacterized protein n=1 Tax=Synaphobranchus kaupii TaxID=118154 RepID=A0A9Q1FTQ7_SYNKA|nr:hypothetical protein SKAU_G00147390 [Synaphobranchus kaupii]